ncbi:MAG: adhA [Elusimicrobia bacterium]|nr:MAG: adhA [Elusimicrobiota bacterium]
MPSFSYAWGMTIARAYAAQDAASALSPWTFTRREPGEKDIEIAVRWCGICHSDLHQARNEWGASTFPMVPGHEIVGAVTRVGKKAKKFKVGDTAAVGCVVDSCRKCVNCKRGLEQHCLTRVSFTYNCVEQDGKTVTQGGYSDKIVVDEGYAFTVAGKHALERVAPLLCAGITTYSPLKRHGTRKGTRVGVLGLGGLGHMAVKIAAAMGAEVTVFSGSPAKKADAKRLGAHEIVLSKESEKAAGRQDLIIDTVSADHDLNQALGWLKTEGTLVLVGAPPKPQPVHAFSLIGGRKRLEGSGVGGMKETQEMLNFCLKKGALSDVEVVGFPQVNQAYERLLKGDVATL